jgi:hypothetical protein
MVDTESTTVGKICYGGNRTIDSWYYWTFKLKESLQKWGKISLQWCFQKILHLWTAATQNLAFVNMFIPLFTTLKFQ